MRVPSAICKLLAKANPNYRYGLAWLPGQGRTFCLCVLTTREVGGSDDPSFRPGLTFYPHDLKDRWFWLQDVDGSILKDLPPGKVPVILGFPGQINSFGNGGVANGDHVAFLLHYGKPLYAVEDDNYETTRSAGRDMDNHVEAEGNDLAEFGMRLKKNPGSSDPVTIKADTKASFKNAENHDFFLTHEKAKENSFEHAYLKDAGFKPR